MLSHKAGIVRPTAHVCRARHIITCCWMGLLTIVLSSASSAASVSHVKRDEQGRIGYIIDFDLPGGVIERSAQSMVDAFVDAIEVDYGVKPRGIFRHVGKGMVAFLNNKQHGELLSDSRIRRVTPDFIGTFSASDHYGPYLPVWNDVQGSEVTSWGQVAVGAAGTSSRSVEVFVIDAGVGRHADLNVDRRLNAHSYSESRLGRLIGCYPHGTHVAGIIGALASNGTGISGIRPNAKIVSVTVFHPDEYNSSDDCLESDDVSAGDLALALDRTAIELIGSGTPGVVNISMNFPEQVTAQWSTLGEKFLQLATPVPDPYLYYPGAVIVQSAGNYYVDSTTWAYFPAATNDGIIVVGGINQHGQPVTPLNNFMGYRNLFAANQPGSNYGPHVEMWAPSARIVSLFSDPLANQSANTIYTNKQSMSGTSMAAPHVAALAVKIIEESANPAISPGQVELQLRQLTSPIGSVDAQNGAIAMPHLAPLPVPSVKPYGEFVAGRGVNLFSPESPSAEPRDPDAWQVQVNSLDHGNDLTHSVGFAAIGASGCEISRYTAHPNSFGWPVETLGSVGPAGQAPGFWNVHAGGSVFSYFYASVNCPSAVGLISDGGFIAHMNPINWIVNGATVPAVFTVQSSSTSPAQVGYSAAVEVISCQLRRFRCTSSFTGSVCTIPFGDVESLPPVVSSISYPAILNEDIMLKLNCASMIGGARFPSFLRINIR